MDRVRAGVFGWVAMVIAASVLAGCRRSEGPAAGGDSGASGAGSVAEAKPEPWPAICEDDLRDIVLLGPLSLPSGVEAPVGSRIGFAVGAANTILKTADGGATWRRLLPRDPKGPEFNAVTFTGASNGWAVSSSVLLHTTDAGEHWVAAARLPGNFYYYGAGSGTAASYHQMQPATYGTRIYRTGDGGLSWQTLPGALPRNDFEAMWFLDESRGWVVGRGGRTAFTTDGGATWESADIAEGGTLLQVQFVSSETGWARIARGHRGGPWATRDGGRTWQVQSADVQPAWTIEDFHFTDAQTGYLLVGRGADGTALMKTADGGATWTEAGVYAPGLTCLTVSEPGVGAAAGDGGRYCRLSL